MGLGIQALMRQFSVHSDPRVYIRNAFLVDGCLVRSDGYNVVKLFEYDSASLIYSNSEIIKDSPCLRVAGGTESDTVVEVSDKVITSVNERFSLVKFGDCDAEWFSFPDIDQLPSVSYVKCSCCGGAGRNSECPECEGEGTISHSNKYNSYEIDCASCDGVGSIGHGHVGEKCRSCNGEGSHVDASEVTHFDGADNKLVISLVSARKFARLPNAKISLQGDWGAVKFDGGVAVCQLSRC